MEREAWSVKREANLVESEAWRVESEANLVEREESPLYFVLCTLYLM